MLAVVISTFNEAENLPHLIPALRCALEGYRYQVIVVDDNSPDGTWQVAQELAKECPLRVIRRPRKLGLGSAILTGLTEALSDPSCDRVVTMDADLSHDPRDLQRLLEASEGVDLVQGSKHIRGSRVQGHGLARRLLSSGANLLLRLALRSPLRDNTGSYRVYSRRLAELLVKEGLPGNFEYAPHAVVVALEHEAKLREVPITFVDRCRGKSKLTAGITFGSLLSALRIAVRRNFGRHHRAWEARDTRGPLQHVTQGAAADGRLE